MAYELYTPNSKPVREGRCEVLRRGMAIHINPRGLTELENPSFVELLYDESIQRIGIRKVTASSDDRFKVQAHLEAPGKIVHCPGFFAYFNLMKRNMGPRATSYDETSGILSFMWRQR